MRSTHNGGDDRCRHLDDAQCAGWTDRQGDRARRGNQRQLRGGEQVTVAHPRSPLRCPAEVTLTITGAADAPCAISGRFSSCWHPGAARDAGGLGVVAAAGGHLSGSAYGAADGRTAGRTIVCPSGPPIVAGAPVHARPRPALRFGPAARELFPKPLATPAAPFRHCRAARRGGAYHQYARQPGVGLFDRGVYLCWLPLRRHHICGDAGREMAVVTCRVRCGF